VVSLCLVASAGTCLGPRVVIGIRERKSRFRIFRAVLHTGRCSRRRTEAATTTRDEIDLLMRARDCSAARCSLHRSEHHGNELATFLPRPAFPPPAMSVLPDGVLEPIEAAHQSRRRLVRRTARRRRRPALSAPAAARTAVDRAQTIPYRYLTSRLANLTVILLTGRSIRFLDQGRGPRPCLPAALRWSCSRRRSVAIDRYYNPCGNPLLSRCLDSMDGVGRGRGRTVLLTPTGRHPGTALADRPGRVDWRSELPRPPRTAGAAVCVLLQA